MASMDDVLQALVVAPGTRHQQWESIVTNWSRAQQPHGARRPAPGINSGSPFPILTAPGPTGAVPSNPTVPGARHQASTVGVHSDQLEPCPAPPRCQAPCTRHQQWESIVTNWSRAQHPHGARRPAPGINSGSPFPILTAPGPTGAVPSTPTVPGALHQASTVGVHSDQLEPCPAPPRCQAPGTRHQQWESIPDSHCTRTNWSRAQHQASTVGVHSDQLEPCPAPPRCQAPGTRHQQWESIVTNWSRAQQPHGARRPAPGINSGSPFPILTAPGPTGAVPSNPTVPGARHQASTVGVHSDQLEPCPAPPRCQAPCTRHQQWESIVTNWSRAQHPHGARHQASTVGVHSRFSLHQDQLEPCPAPPRCQAPCTRHQQWESIVTNWSRAQHPHGARRPAPGINSGSPFQILTAPGPTGAVPSTPTVPGAQHQASTVGVHSDQLEPCPAPPRCQAPGTRHQQWESIVTNWSRAQQPHGARRPAPGINSGSPFPILTAPGPTGAVPSNPTVPGARHQASTVGVHSDQLEPCPAPPRCQAPCTRHQQWESIVTNWSRAQHPHGALHQASTVGVHSDQLEPCPAPPRCQAPCTRHQQWESIVTNWSRAQHPHGARRPAPGINSGSPFPILTAPGPTGAVPSTPTVPGALHQASTVGVHSDQLEPCPAPPRCQAPGTRHQQWESIPDSHCTRTNWSRAQHQASTVGVHSDQLEPCPAPPRCQAPGTRHQQWESIVTNWSRAQQPHGARRPAPGINSGSPFPILTAPGPTGAVPSNPTVPGARHQASTVGVHSDQLEPCPAPPRCQAPCTRHQQWESIVTNWSRAQHPHGARRPAPGINSGSP
ncbi:hypothetical protein NDU88_006406 [Pleurodeles waltl]|uniref:Uncharacterized protein n=1 Tax=Pleurodeles waltl TaxID=8319 RepID=A0AAV7L7K3_PLEWA|nr:hypothetical protein NDU88_006406 [Pleurodeles waltl]